MRLTELQPDTVYRTTGDLSQSATSIRPGQAIICQATTGPELKTVTVEVTRWSGPRYRQELHPEKRVVLLPVPLGERAVKLDHGTTIVGDLVSPGVTMELPARCIRRPLCSVAEWPAYVATHLAMLDAAKMDREAQQAEDERRADRLRLLLGRTVRQDSSGRFQLTRDDVDIIVAQVAAADAVVETAGALSRHLGNSATTSDLDRLLDAYREARDRR